MRIGLLRRYNPSLTAYLARLGFRSAEIEFRVGDAFDPTAASQAEMDAALAEFRVRDIEIAALASYGNLLDPNTQAAQACERWLRVVMQTAARQGIPVVGVMAGRDPSLPVLANLPRFVDVFGPLVEEAETLGVRLAIENCPKFHAFPFRSTNFAFSMEAYDAIFAALPSPNLGLEYDPSHPVMMLMDSIEWIYHYGERIFHVHAKDAEVVWREIRRNGIYADGAFRYRLPGLGDVDWGRVVSALIEVGYRGPLNIEGQHDPVYSGELEEQGLILARRHLEQFVPGAQDGAGGALQATNGGPLQAERQR